LHSIITAKVCVKSSQCHTPNVTPMVCSDL
jgi:hypothetical protein